MITGTAFVPSPHLLPSIMLKRLRPASPTFPSTTEPEDGSIPDPKRRRMLPPTLDGMSRSLHCHYTPDLEDDEEDDTNVDESFQHDPTQSREYRSANHLLHDLHASHRHRLIFSSASSPLLQSLDRREFPVKDVVQTSSPLQRDKFYDSSSINEDGAPVGELESVKIRYQDNNKLLGSLVLNRRRQLDSDT
ncbi:unnamed protein product [Mycena citricolor]|uniref:Uncharacterized protein n=1 Tax=Mycena citricolor TaxID=2018698 RepID=A0AAD2K5M6_9AGAR|nr:unnamed protein product [Mycena citricolor]